MTLAQPKPARLPSIRYALPAGRISWHRFILWILEKKRVSCCNSFWKVISLKRDGKKRKGGKKVKWNKNLRVSQVLSMNFPAASLFPNLLLLKPQSQQIQRYSKTHRILSFTTSCITRNILGFFLFFILKICSPCKQHRFFSLPAPVHKADKAQDYTVAPVWD